MSLEMLCFQCHDRLRESLDQLFKIIIAERNTYVHFNKFVLENNLFIEKVVEYMNYLVFNLRS